MAAFVEQDEAHRGDVTEVPASLVAVVSGVYTATASQRFGVGRRARIVEAVYSQTAGTVGQSLVLSIDAFNESSQTWEQLISSAAITSSTTATVVVQVNPYSAPISNSSAQRVVRRKMRVTVTHADNKNVTYSIDVHVEG